MSSKLITWDTQTGVVIKELDVKFSSHWSGCQIELELARMVHTLGNDAFNVVEFKKGESLSPHWIHEGSLYAAMIIRIDEGFEITIREFRSTPTSSYPVVESFHVLYRDKESSSSGSPPPTRSSRSVFIASRLLPPCSPLPPPFATIVPRTPTPTHSVARPFHLLEYPDLIFFFSPVFRHVSFITDTEVLILDVRDSSTLLRAEATGESYHPRGLFSPDGRFFACQTRSGNISVWKNTLVSCISWSTVRPRLSCERFSFSPTATSILACGPNGIQLLRLENCVGPLTPIITESEIPDPHSIHLVTSSVDGAHIATARRRGHIITIHDSLSGAPQHSIDTGLGIEDIRFVHNTILVLGHFRIAQWSLGTGGVREVEVGSGIPAGIPLWCPRTLSNDGTKIVRRHSGGKLLMYDVKESQQIDSCIAGPWIPHWVEGIQFSPCGSKLWSWSVPCHDGLGYQFDTDCHLTQVEIEGGHFTSSTKHNLKDGWSLLDFFQSRDGFRIGRGGRWVEDSGGRKLFWLPPNWRARHVNHVVWEDNFLAIVDGSHDLPIIIKFQP